MVLEYVLLMTIAVSLAVIILTLFAKRDLDNPENSGALILKWRGLQEVIGTDRID